MYRKPRSITNFSDTLGGLDDVIITNSPDDNRILKYDSVKNSFTDSISVSIDGTFTADSDLQISTQKATKTYTDLTTGSVSTIGINTGVLISEKNNLTRVWSDVSRTFTITSSSYPYNVYIKGLNYPILGQKQVSIPDIEGIWLFYYAPGATYGDEAILTAGYVASMVAADPYILNFIVGVGQVYWSSVLTGGSGKAVTIGTLILAASNITNTVKNSYSIPVIHTITSSCILADFILDGDGSSLDHVRFSMSAGNLASSALIDQAITNKIKTATKRIVYYEWVGGPVSQNIIRIIDDTNGVPVIAAPAGRLYYNQSVGGQMQLTEVTNNYHVLCHIFVIASLDNNFEYVFVIGQAEYLLIADARNAALTEMASLQIGLTSARTFARVGSVIFKSSTGYVNAYKARISSVDGVNPYVDHRIFLLGGGAGSGNVQAVSDHGNLSGLADDDHPHYALRSNPVTFTLVTNTGTKYTPIGANPGDANTLWSDSGDSNKIKQAANTVMLGPTTSVDNTIPKYDSTGGNLLQSTQIVIDDLQNITGIHNFTGVGDTLKFGDTTQAENKLIHYQGKEEVHLWLEADTDNVTEADTPTIIFTQDGTQTGGRIGFNASNQLVITTASTTGTENEAVLFYTGNNQIVDGGTPGTLPINWTLTTLQLGIYGPNAGPYYVKAHTNLELASGARINEFSIDGTLAGNTDIAVPTEKAVKTYVDGLFSSGSFSVDFTGPWAGDQTKTIYYNINNNTCSLTIPTTSAVSNNNTAITLTAPVAAAYRPLQDNKWVCKISDDATLQFGLIKILTTGQIGVHPDATEIGNFTGGGAATGFSSTTITYRLA